MVDTSLWQLPPVRKSDADLLAIVGREMKELYVDSLIGADAGRALAPGSPLLDILQVATERSASRLKSEYLTGHLPRLDDSKDIAELSLRKILERFRRILCAEISDYPIGSSPREAIIILAPTLVTLLELPLQHAAIAVPLSILISRMAIRALCLDTQEEKGDEAFTSERIRICRRSILALEAERATCLPGSVPELLDAALRRAEAKLAALQSRLTSTEASMKVFISHSSADRDAAGAFVEFLRAALLIPAKDIRCTSVDGYKLPAGANAEEQLRQEVFDAEAFVALISRTSLTSIYVMFELGARWGAKGHLVPLMIAGVSPAHLKAPLSVIHAVSATSEGDLHQLVDALATRLNVQPEKPNAYMKAMKGFMLAAK